MAYERTVPQYNVVGFFSNSCIEPRREYFKRLDAVRKFAGSVGMELVEDEYDPDGFLLLAEGLEKEPEKGRRCLKCIDDRMLRTMRRALDTGFDKFATTLTTSPRKDAGYINEAGAKLAWDYEIDYLQTNFKKQDGFKRSVEISKILGLYRQDYCGCRFSLKQRQEQKRLKAEREAELEKGMPTEYAETVDGDSSSQGTDPNIGAPPGAFFKPAADVSRRFKSGRRP